MQKTFKNFENSNYIYNDSNFLSFYKFKIIRTISNSIFNYKQYYYKY